MCPNPLLLAAFALLMLVVGGLMATCQVRGRRELRTEDREPQPAVSVPGEQRTVPTAASGGGLGATRPRRPLLDDPIITFSPAFACQCPRALEVLVAATAEGLLTGFLGVGGGFLVVPALAASVTAASDPSRRNQRKYSTSPRRSSRRHSTLVGRLARMGEAGHPLPLAVDANNEVHVAWDAWPTKAAPNSSFSFSAAECGSVQPSTGRSLWAAASSAALLAAVWSGWTLTPVGSKTRSP